MQSLLCGFCSSGQRFARGLIDSPHPASFRFHLAMDTLAFGYILPATGRIRDFHPLERAPAGRTMRRTAALASLRLRQQGYGFNMPRDNTIDVARPRVIVLKSARQ